MASCNPGQTDHSTTTTRDTTGQTPPNSQKPRFCVSSSVLFLRGFHGCIPKNIRNSSISLIDDGRSSREIEAQLGVSYSTVSRVRAEARQDAQKCRGGRPTKLTATDERWVVRMVTKGEVDNAAQAARQLTD